MVFLRYGHRQKRVDTDMFPQIDSIVIRSKDVEALCRFYQALGMRFQQERHGDGPFHYASLINGAVLEIYPCKANETTDNCRLSFVVASLEDVLSELMKMDAPVVSQPRQLPRYLSTVVKDPDGRSIEIKQHYNSEY